MTRAEERANEAYPFKEGDIVYDEERVKETQGYYIEGYEQAEKDFMKKARFWLECNLSHMSSEDVKFWVEDFVQTMNA